MTYETIDFKADRGIARITLKDGAGEVNDMGVLLLVHFVVGGCR